MAVVVAGAKRHDLPLWAATRDAVVIERPKPTAEAPQPVGADQDDDDPECRQEAARLYAIAPIHPRGEERQAQQTMPGDRAWRWVGVVCHAWCNRFRNILVRVETQLATPLA